MRTSDPDRRLHHIVATPGLLSCHQPVSAERQLLVVAGHQVPGDGAGGRVSQTAASDFIFYLVFYTMKIKYFLFYIKKKQKHIKLDS